MKVLFDSGSQSSYKTYSLKSKETETLHLNTFGEKNFQKQKCDLATFLLNDLDNEPSKTSVLSFQLFVQLFSHVSTQVITNTLTDRFRPMSLLNLIIAGTL